MEIQRKYKIITKGAKVLDLGAAPGSWTQFALTIVGPEGMIVGVDLKPIEYNFPPNVITLKGDMTDYEFVESLVSNYSPFDVVLSDMAPNTMGNKHADSAKSALLTEQAFQVALRTLTEGGHFLAKIFQGEDTQRIVQDIRKHFDKVKIVKPLASRKESKEIYILAIKRRC